MRASLALAMTVMAIVAFAAPAGAAEYADYVIEVETGAVLHETDAYSSKFPASLTKMMTLLLMFEAIDRGEVGLNGLMPVSAAAAARPASKLGLPEGDQIRVEDGILALATKSANDVATVIAEYLAGTESAFAERMTLKARSLGMTATSYKNASGLPDDEQRTTAYDISLLARTLYHDFPHYFHFFQNRQFTYRGTVYRNTNRLLGQYDGIDGIKTGYIRASGFNLAASAHRDGHHVIAIVIGGRTARGRDQQVVALLDEAFDTLIGFDTVLAGIERPEIKPVWATALIDSLADVEPETVRLDPTAYDSNTSWSIQVGAFADPQTAELTLDQVALEVPELLADSRPLVASALDAYGPVFRARQIGLTEARARQACAVLESRNWSCMVSAPESTF